MCYNPRQMTPTNRSALPRTQAALLTDAIVRKLVERLPALIASGEGGQKIIIHIAPGHKTAKIEWPPDIDDVRPGT